MTTTITKPKKFDLIDLEEKVNNSYLSWKEANNDRTRTGLFTSIENLAYAILNVHKTPRIKSDLKNVAYEYAVYLFERIILGLFVPVFKDKMPWQSYIDLNLKHIIFKKDKDSWLDLLSDVEHLINIEESIYDTDTLKVTEFLDDLSFELMKQLRFFFTEEEIREKTPLALDIIFSNDFKKKNNINKLPDGIRDFVNVLVLLSKRVVRLNNLNENYTSFSKNLSVDSALKSTLFLSSIVNSSFIKKELLMALDLDSIHRLVLVLGGEKIKIPTQREFGTFLGSVSIASKVLFENVPIKKSISKVKKDLDLVFSHQVNVQKYISKIIESSNLDDREHSHPLIASLLGAIKLYEQLFNNFINDICNNYSEEALKSYKELSNAIDGHIKSMQFIKKCLDNFK